MRWKAPFNLGDEMKEWLFAALVAIRVAQRPADAGHPFGHHKGGEFFSAVLEGVMIIVAALFILREAWAGFMAAPGHRRAARGAAGQRRGHRDQRRLGLRP